MKFWFGKEDNIKYYVCTYCFITISDHTSNNYFKNSSCEFIMHVMLC